jgi:hypothetical protein
MRKTRLGQAKGPQECFLIAAAVMDVKCSLIRAESSARAGGVVSVRKHLDSAMKDSFRLKQLYPEGAADVDLIVDETMALQKKVASLNKKPKPGQRAEFAIGLEKTMNQLHLVFDNSKRTCGIIR